MEEIFRSLSPWQINCDSRRDVIYIWPGLHHIILFNTAIKINLICRWKIQQYLAYMLSTKNYAFLAQRFGNAFFVWLSFLPYMKLVSTHLLAYTRNRPVSDPMVERISGLLMRIWWRHDVNLRSTLLTYVAVNGLLDLSFILLAVVFVVSCAWYRLIYCRLYFIIHI
jgi:hypothetical protein